MADVPELSSIDYVNHPPHYGQHPTGIECIEVVEEFNFNIGNAIKYLWRAGLKGNEIEDLKKAQWYVLREINRKESQPCVSPQSFLYQCCPECKNTTTT
jgi:Protein of unknwon function (DUF3310)